MGERVAKALLEQRRLLGYEGMPTPEVAEGLPTYDPELLKRIGNALATMPSVQGVRDAVTAPVDAYQGKFDPTSDEGIGRALGMAGLAMTGGVAGTGAGGVALGSGPMKPNKLTFREAEQHRTGQLSGPVSELNPIVAIVGKDGEHTILDGHNRAKYALKNEPNSDLAVNTISADNYAKLKKLGYDDMEIAYAVHSTQGNEISEYAASALNQQFPGARIAERGSKAENALLDLLDEAK